jgi:predicted ferric reductase
MKQPDVASRPSELTTMAYRVVLISALFLFLAGVLAIPSYYETTTLWYKIGIDKTMLKAGQFVGLVALVLIYLQLILSTRGQFLDNVFGAGSLIQMHRMNGILIVLMAGSHILLVLIPEGISNLPVGKKFWPEMVGATLFLLIFIIAVTSHFREKLRLPYKTWRICHKPMGYLVLFLITIHVLFVSESFEKSLPKTFIIAACIILVMWIAAVKWSSRKTSHTKHNTKNHSKRQ